MNGKNTGSSAAEKKIVQRALRDLLKELQKLYGKDVPEILVYGSQARGSATVDSDIDLLLLYRKGINPGKEIQRMAPILADLNLRYGVLISVLPAAEGEYQDSTEMFWRNVRKEGVPIEAI